MVVCSAELRVALATACDDALGLLFPVVCAGCDRWGRSVCADCRRSLIPAPQRRTSESGLAVRAPFVYDGTVASCVRSLKERGRTGVARVLGPALGSEVRALLVEANARRAVLVPVPTSRSAFRRRGYRVPDLLIQRAGLPVTRALQLVRPTADQRRLSRTDRQVNVASAMRAHGVAGRMVVIVDDVTTTGATLEEAARAVRAADAHVVGAVVAAATPRTDVSDRGSG